jgi:hypothetical protein
VNERGKGVIAVLLVGALAYAVYTQASGLSLVPEFNIAEPPPEPDISSLSELTSVSRVEMVPILGGEASYDLGGRNLFQYGKPKPPPPTAAELEAIRLAEEERLKLLEEQARLAAEKRKAGMEAAALRAKAEAERLKNQRKIDQQKIAEAPKPKKPPPPITLKLVGWLGRPDARIAVFVKGDAIVLAKQGEEIEGKFKILSMGLESVVMGYVDPQFQDATKRIQMGS